MRSCTAFIVVLSCLLVACGSPPKGERREFKLQGQVLSVSPDHKEAKIKHEEIRGFMSAMTMTYHVKDAKELESLAPGDLVNAALIVVSNDAYLESVTKVGNAPLEMSSAGTMALDILTPGQPVADVALIDQDGKAVALHDFRGSAVVITFTYTGCPMPDMCPMLDRKFAAIQQKLQAQNGDLRARLLSVSIDPAKDTPPVLEAHGKALGLNPTIWTFATGERDVIDAWARQFGVSVAREPGDTSSITHNVRTAILDRQGKLVLTYAGQNWTPEQVITDVRTMVGVG